MRSLLISVSIIALMVPMSVYAAETVAYSYDARGRLIKVVRSGSAQSNSNVTTDYSHDKANNRKQLVTINSPNSSGTPPSPPPPPPPVNSPPTTVADALTVNKCGIGDVNVIANDSDPEGNVPLVVTGASNANPAKGTAYAVSASTVRYEADPGGATGSDSVTYTVRDSLGATSTGTVNITIRTTGACSLTAAPPTSDGG